MARDAAGEPAEFLEFGTGEGRGIASASAVFTSPDSLFVGFDTFEGLPEAWRGSIPDYNIDGVRIREPGEFEIPRGTFATGSLTPRDAGRVLDPRASFVAGLIQTTLPEYLKTTPRGHRIVVNVDVDLYSTTSVILAYLHPRFRFGDVLVFDEFYDELGEFKAFADHLAATGEWGRWRVIGHDGKVFVFQRGA